MSVVLPQLNFPPVTSASATNPFCYVEEPLDKWGRKVTASPVYTPVALAENVEITINSTPLNIMQAGSVYSYSRQTAGQNFPFHIDVSPIDINFIKIGANAPNFTTPSGTCAASYQFLMKYRQSLGITGVLSDVYLFLLGCRPLTTSMNVTAQGKLTVGMDWQARQMLVDTTANGGLTTPDIPDLSDIVGPVIVDSDAGSKPLTVDGKDYATDGFTLNVDCGMIQKPYNGSGLIEVQAPGFNNTTGNFTTAVGDQGVSIENIALASQIGVPLEYKFKPGVMIAHVDKAIFTSMARSFPGQPTTVLENPVTFEARSTNLATT